MPKCPRRRPTCRSSTNGARGASNAVTIRQQLEKHRAKAECASCHSRMDPLGFGLENFDALGRWRTEQGGQPVDSSGVLPTGEKFERAGRAEGAAPGETAAGIPSQLLPQDVRIRPGPRDHAAGHVCGQGLRPGPGTGRIPLVAAAGNDRGELPVLAPTTKAVRGHGREDPRPLSRRTFLRGAGVALGLPLLEAMLPRPAPRWRRRRRSGRGPGAGRLPVLPQRRLDGRLDPEDRPAPTTSCPSAWSRWSRCGTRSWC